jgi:hypothetical protein
MSLMTCPLLLSASWLHTSLPVTLLLQQQKEVEKASVYLL